MRARWFLPLFVSALTAGCEPEMETTKAPPVPLAEDEGGWKVLVDFDAFPRPPTIDDATVQEKVIAPVVRGPFVLRKEDCASANAHAVARATGGYHGAFSARGADEHIYLVHAYECGGEPHEKHHLVMFSGDKVALDAEVPEQMVAEVMDVDQDGDNEILLIGGSHDGGAFTLTARLVDTENGQLETLFDFKEIAKSTCPDGTAESPLGEVSRRGDTDGLRGGAAHTPV